MKKIIVLFLFVSISFSAWSLVGFGIHAGFDMTKIDAYSKDFTVRIGGQEGTYSLQREEISAPAVLGGQVYIDLPVFPIGFEGGFEVAGQQYSWIAPNYITLSNGMTVPLNLGFDENEAITKEDFYFLRAQLDATAKYYFLKLPKLKFYIGAGGGLNFITPIVSEDLFVKEFSNMDYNFDSNTNQTAELDVKELAGSVASLGGHGVIGMQFKPMVIPLSFNLDYKYNVTAENDYKDETNHFGTIKASINIYF